MKWKVYVIKNAENLFEQLCEENGIKYTPYPKPFKGIYSAECSEDALLKIGYCIFTIEPMPKATLD